MQSEGLRGIFELGRIRLAALTLSFFFGIGATPQFEREVAAAEAPLVTELNRSVIEGRQVAYEVRMNLTRVEVIGKPLANIFAASYLGTGNRANRPVLFFFPGGPGSAASGLILGGFGPQVVDYSTNPMEQSRLVPNQESLLDAADLVFVDMPEVGFSKILPGVDSKEVFGIRQDARLQAAFIDQWLEQNGRRSAPVFIAGKSYGALRVANTALDLIRNYKGVNLRGLIILSGAWDISAMDFPGGFTTTGDLNAYASFMPTYAAIAWHYGMAGKGETLESFVSRARTFAIRQYLPALVLGQRLPPADRAELSRQIAAFTGLSEAFLFANDNRISSALFRKSLRPGQTLGLDNASFNLEADPHEFGGDTRLDSAWERYLASLRFRHAAHYVRGSLEPAKQWDWLVSDDWRLGYPRATDALGPVMAAAPALHVFVATGYFDLATPFLMAENAVCQLPQGAERIEQHAYPSGHSLWVDEPTRRLLQRDIRTFLASTMALARGEEKLRASGSCDPG